MLDHLCPAGGHADAFLPGHDDRLLRLVFPMRDIRRRL